MRKTLSQTILAAFCAILCATSIGGGSMRRRMMMCGANMPYDRALSYVACALRTGARADAGFYANITMTNNVEVEAKFECLNAEYNPLFCAFNGGSWNPSFAFIVAQDRFSYRWGNSVDTSYVFTTLTGEKIGVFSSTAVINGSTVKTYSEKSFTLPTPFCIMNRPDKLYPFNGKLFYMKLRDRTTGDLIYDFIPVLKDNWPYLYDKVNKTMLAATDTSNALYWA